MSDPPRPTSLAGPELLALPLGDLLSELASAQPSPGAGATAAVVAAMAAALATSGSRRAADGWAGAGGAAAQGERLAGRLAQLAQQNLEAYLIALSRLAPPADRPADASRPGERDRAIAAALERAGALPALIAESACDVVLLAELVADGAGADGSQDGLAAGLLAAAAAEASAHLVAINLAVTPADERLNRARSAADVARVAAERLRSRHA